MARSVVAPKANPPEGALVVGVLLLASNAKPVEKEVESVVSGVAGSWRLGVVVVLPNPPDEMPPNKGMEVSLFVSVV